MVSEVIRTKKFAADAAEFILQEARSALGEGGQFRIALSGGKTPRPVYEELARRGHDLPWERVLFTFGDERCVPPDDKESNFRMANEALFKPAGVPSDSIVRMEGEAEPAVAARKYEDALALLAIQHAEVIYRHDLILLGMGEDGHTASLFPETAALDEQTRTVAANHVPKLEAWRLTFTFPLIAAAKKVLFLIDAAKHGAVLEKVLKGDASYPAGRVETLGAEVTWMLDDKSSK